MNDVRYPPKVPLLSAAARSGGSPARKAFGLAFLALLGLSGALTYAAYTDAFRESVPVTVRAGRVGLGMRPLAEVKMRGVPVGEVRGFTLGRHGGARVELALDPGVLDEIPANVTAAILPTTVFGQKYVALRAPRDPAPQPLSAGDVITETRVPTEVQQALTNLYPLLRAVRPADLSASLNAVATALQGRGERLGDGLRRLDGYLQRLNPQMPRLVEDLRLLATVSDGYRRVTPELGRLLRNQATTTTTLEEKEEDLRALFTGTTRLARSARGLLEVNGDNIVRLGTVTAPTLALLERYSPEYRCLLEGIANWMPHAEQSYRGYVFHMNLETLPRQPTGYAPRDDPKYAAAHGLHGWPTCATLPNPPYSQVNPGPVPPWANRREADDGIAGTHGKYRAAPRYRGAGAR
jgi:phospholipid/cholesterol/gamma-HCH transport system substrate-binding protein